MQSNKTNSIIFIKDAESNLIEEAVIVMKGKLDIPENNKSKVLSKENVLKEAELIINSRLEENNTSFLKFKIEKLIKKNKALKISNIILLISSIILFFA